MQKTNNKQTAKIQRSASRPISVHRTSKVKKEIVLIFSLKIKYILCCNNNKRSYKNKTKQIKEELCNKN